jgi:acyl-CoA oxidase
VTTTSTCATGTWQRELFAWRESHVVAGLARRLGRVPDGDGAAAFDAMNRVQAHSLRAAHAHVHRLMLDAFVSAVDGCTDNGARALLGRACDLYVLSEVEADRGWFLEHGRLTPSGSKAVGRAVDDLCRDLRPQALTLVDGLGIPRSWLGAELAGAAQPSRSST